MNGCSGSALAKFVPSAHARKTSESFGFVEQPKDHALRFKHATDCAQHLSEELVRAPVQSREHPGYRLVPRPDRGRLRSEARNASSARSRSIATRTTCVANSSSPMSSEFGLRVSR